jgi:hypothetical protein
MYSTSITINAKVSNSTADGDIEWIIQSGSIVFNGTTYTITSGNGRMTKINQLVMFGDAKDSSGSTIRWSLQGLTAIYNGTAIYKCLQFRTFSRLCGSVYKPIFSVMSLSHGF